MWAIIIIAYSIWAVYTGYKFLSGRSAWLDSPELVSRITKIILSLILGYFIAGFYLVWLVLKLLFSFWS